jgi:RimJ/RimL family protein N-acetyltransferase
MTTYMNIEADKPRVEIGSTWYARSVQRTAFNTECKLLLLTHAFDTLDCIAVEFRTSSFNFQSRRAIERFGARPDGILRNHMRMPDGSLARHLRLYSILPHEWPAVKKNLLFKLGR